MAARAVVVRLVRLDVVVRRTYRVALQKGTRIAVELVIDLLGRGYTTEQLLKQYDHLTPEDVQACLAYAAEILQSEKVYALPR